MYIAYDPSKGGISSHGVGFKSMSETDQCQVIESWCAVNATVRRTQINHHCCTYCEVGGLIDSLDKVRGKLIVVVFGKGSLRLRTVLHWPL